MDATTPTITQPTQPEPDFAHMQTAIEAARRADLQNAMAGAPEEGSEEAWDAFTNPTQQQSDVGNAVEQSIRTGAEALLPAKELAAKVAALATPSVTTLEKIAEKTPTPPPEETTEAQAS